MAAFVGSCISLFGATLAAAMTVDILAFFLSALLMAAAVGLTFLFFASAKK